MIKVETFRKGSIMTTIEYENKCGDCLFVKPVSEISQKNSIDINITLSFGEYSQKVSFGEVRISLKRLLLALNIKNGTAPYLHRQFTNEMETEFLISRNWKSSSAKSDTKAEDSHLDVSFSTKEIKSAFNEAHKTQLSASSNNELSDTFDTIKNTVSSIGSEENPKWIFETLPGDSVLKGVINNKKLCKIIANENNISNVKALFTAHITSRDIHLQGTGGLWPKKISRGKYALLQHLAYKQFKNKIDPYISKTHVTYEGYTEKVA